MQTRVTFGPAEGLTKDVEPSNEQQIGGRSVGRKGVLTGSHTGSAVGRSDGARECAWSVNGQTVGKIDGGSHDRTNRRVDGQQTAVSPSNKRSAGRSVGQSVGWSGVRACLRVTDGRDQRSVGRSGA